jgi:hypothetical protein
MNVYDVERLMDTQNFSRHRKTTIKYQKPVVKVVHDMLIKKWVFMKRKKQFRARSPVFVHK